MEESIRPESRRWLKSAERSRDNDPEEGEAAALEVGVPGIHPELIRLLGRMKFRTKLWAECIEAFYGSGSVSGLLAGEIGLDVRMAKRAGLLHDIGKSIDHDVEGIPYSDRIGSLQKIQRIPDRDQCSRVASRRRGAGDIDRLCCTGS